MIKDNLFTYLRALNSIRVPKANSIFRYGVAKNIKILQSEIKFIEDFEKRSEEFNKYEQQRIDICEKYSEKTEQGVSVKKISPEGYEEYKFVNEKIEVATAELDKLREDNLEVVEKEEERLKELHELLQSEAQVELHKIATINIPEDLPQEIFNVLVDDIFVENL